MAVNATVQVTMPAMGESVTEGTVLEWHKQEGDPIEADEVLVEISTDKVDAEGPAPAGGTIAKIHVAEGDTVEVGQVLAEISPNGAKAASGNGGAPVVEQEPAEAAEADIVDIVTPTGGESVTEGTILEWAVQVGDAVQDGQTVVEVSTDKVDMELPAPVAGTITEILAGAGETVSVGQVIARMRPGDGSLPGTDGAVTAPSAAAAPAAPPAANGAPAPPAPPPAARGAPASPVARRVAAAEGVDLSAVSGSGPAGRITKADVLAAKAGPAPVAAPAAVAAPPSGATQLRGGAAMLA